MKKDMLRDKNSNKRNYFATALGMFVFGALFLFAGHVFADTQDIGGVAKHITESFSDIGHLLFAVAYIAGFTFVIAGIFKFKQHKDNPTQIPMGTPIAMVLIGITLVFLPSLLPSAGKTLFVTPQKGGWSGTGIEQSMTGQ